MLHPTQQLLHRYAQGEQDFKPLGLSQAGLQGSNPHKIHDCSLLLPTLGVETDQKIGERKGG